MTNFELKYVNIDSSYYREAVTIREELFFKNIENRLDLIQDKFESTGIHLVCLKDNEVIGTGRLNIENNTGVISQMAIKPEYHKLGVGARILIELVNYSKKNELFKVKLGARETALTFYKKFNFVIVGERYPSKKTGVIHHQMELKID